VADNQISVFRFADVLDAHFTAPELPVATKFFRQVNALQRSILVPTKDVWNRPRPFAARALDAWTTGEPLQHIPWQGSLLAAGFLRSRRETRHYLAGPNVGQRAIPREKRRARDPVVRLVAMLEAIQASAEAGLKITTAGRRLRSSLVNN
jgi:hypothetical protein